jgi:hypothetical protein
VEEMTDAQRDAEGQRLRWARQNVGQLGEIIHPDKLQGQSHFVFLFNKLLNDSDPEV